MKPTVQISIDCPEQEEQEILIALLGEAGIDAFEQSRDILRAYCREESFNDGNLKHLLRNYKWTSQNIEPQNWNQNWESSFEPVLINHFCSIRASFHAAPPSVVYDILITPKMSFGTGHHATTWLMVDQMSRLAFTNKSVVDFGTGTGILAILARKMGASNVLAIDNDDWSIDNAKENILANGVEGISLEKADRLPENSSFDLILANINKHVLLEHLESVKQHLNPGGVVVFSGLLAGDRQDMISESESVGLKLLSGQERENWISLVFHRQA